MRMNVQRSEKPTGTPLDNIDILARDLPSFFIHYTKNLFKNMDIYQITKIKIHQKITKSSTVFTNMMLNS